MGEDGEDAGVVDARSHVKYRGNPDRLADLPQTGPHPVDAGFPEQEAELGVGDGTAAGLHDQHVLLEELFGHRGVIGVVLNPRVCTADDGGHPADPSGHDGVVERPERCPI